MDDTPPDIVEMPATIASFDAQGPANNPILLDWRAHSTAAALTSFALEASAPGTVLIAGNGNLYYDPQGAFTALSADETAVVHAVLNIEDASATVTVTVHGIDDPTVLGPDGPFTTNSFTSLLLDVVANDSDPDGEVALLSATVTPGSATVENGKIRFVPVYSVAGAYDIVYMVTGNITGHVTVNVTRAAVFVDDDAAAGGDGHSWETAFKDVQAGIDAAGGAQIWVKAGSYAAIVMTPNTQLFGGFSNSVTPPGSLADRPAISHLDAGSSGSVVVAASGSTIDGFTVEGGNAATGGGIFASAVSGLTLHNVILLDNLAHHGAGLYASNSSITLTHVTFDSNKAIGLATAGAGDDGLGGALFGDAASTIIIDDATFIHNTAQGAPGANGGGGPSAGIPGFDGGLARGGAVFLQNGGTLQVSHATFNASGAFGGSGGVGGHRTLASGSKGVTGGAGGAAEGGTFYVADWDIMLSDCTIAGSSALGGPGGAGGDGQPLTASAAFDGGVGGPGGHADAGIFLLADQANVTLDRVTLAGGVQGGTGGNGGNAEKGATATGSANGGNSGPGGGAAGAFLVAQDTATDPTFKLRACGISSTVDVTAGAPGTPGTPIGPTGVTGSLGGTSGAEARYLVCVAATSACVTADTCDTFDADCYTSEPTCPIDTASCQ